MLLDGAAIFRERNESICNFRLEVRHTVKIYFIILKTAQISDQVYGYRWIFKFLENWSHKHKQVFLLDRNQIIFWEGRIHRFRQGLPDLNVRRKFRPTEGVTIEVEVVHKDFLDYNWAFGRILSIDGASFRRSRLVANSRGSHRSETVPPPLYPSLPV